MEAWLYARFNDATAPRVLCQAATWKRLYNFTLFSSRNLSLIARSFCRRAYRCLCIWSADSTSRIFTADGALRPDVWAIFILVTHWRYASNFTLQTTSQCCVALKCSTRIICLTTKIYGQKNRISVQWRLGTRTSLFLQRLPRSASSSPLHCQQPSIFGCWPQGWNCLPPLVMSVSSLTTFRTRLETFPLTLDASDIFVSTHCI